ncbi:MAG TPA: tetratricopeptide repeat protein, partial [Candidatus Nanopelagicales bacterium]|nr:tetratricopeptide repeat protein [Candidatus Nanopelagicales bacterium]
MRLARATGLVLFALAACRDGGAGSGPPPAPSSDPPAASTTPPPRKTNGFRTTDGGLALRNLDAQIKTAERAADARPQDVDTHDKLIRLLLDRGSFLGRYADLEHALKRAETLVKTAPDRPDAYRARAAARSALHLFKDALADLDRAQTLGAKPADLDPARAAALTALGRLDDALPLRIRAREARSTIVTLGAEAALLGEMGRLDEAEQRFTQALEAYRDVSPFPVAWLALERGLMW